MLAPTLDGEGIRTPFPWERCLILTAESEAHTSQTRFPHHHPLGTALQPSCFLLVQWVKHLHVFLTEGILQATNSKVIFKIKVKKVEANVRKQFLDISTDKKPLTAILTVF